MFNADELSFREEPSTADAAAPIAAEAQVVQAPASAPNRIAGFVSLDDTFNAFEPKPAIEPTQRVVANPTGRCAVLDATGHTELAWDTRDPDSVKAAKEKFDDLVSNRRYLAFKVNDDGTKGEQIKAFDPEIEDMILIPPMQGG